MREARAQPETIGGGIGHVGAQPAPLHPHEQDPGVGPGAVVYGHGRTRQYVLRQFLATARRQSGTKGHRRPQTPPGEGEAP